jgi:hypothetical protein
LAEVTVADGVKVGRLLAGRVTTMTLPLTTTTLAVTAAQPLGTPAVDAVVARNNWVADKEPPMMRPGGTKLAPTIVTTTGAVPLPTTEVGLEWSSVAATG